VRLGPAWRETESGVYLVEDEGDVARLAHRPQLPEPPGIPRGRVLGLPGSAGQQDGVVGGRGVEVKGLDRVDEDGGDLHGAPARRRMTASEAGCRSLRPRQSSRPRSLPSPGWTPSHQPW